MAKQHTTQKLTRKVVRRRNRPAGRKHAKKLGPKDRP